MELDRVLTARPADRDCGGRAGMPMIDLGRALDLLTTAVQGGGRPQCLVGRCLSLAGVDARDLDALDGHAVRELYRRDALPVKLTLGALVLFDAVQRGQDRGCGWDEAVEYAGRVVERFLDVVPPSRSGNGRCRQPSGVVAVLAGSEQTERS